MTSLELRILTGLHAQAHCSISETMNIGQSPDCDIVLADEGMPPQLGSLHYQDTRWFLQTPSGQSSSSASKENHTLNEPVFLGSIWLTVAEPAMSWPELPPNAESMSNSSPPMSDTPTATDDMAPPISDLKQKKLASSPSLLVPAYKVSSRSYRTIGVLSLSTISLMVLAIVIFVLIRPTHMRPANKLTSSLAAAEQSMHQISAILEKLGMASRIHISLRRNGTVLVSGWVRDKQEEDRLSAALAQTSPLPAMRISNEQLAVMNAEHVLQGFGVRYKVRHLGQGRLLIDGIASSARERATALDAVRAQLPGMTILGGAIALSQEVSDRLTTQLNRASFSGVKLVWKTDRLEVNAPGLDDKKNAQLNHLVQTFNTTHFNVATLFNQALSENKNVASSVPFEIRSVIGGVQPYLVLSDGSKLAPGASYQNYHLSAIEAKRIVFDGLNAAILTR